MSKECSVMSKSIQLENELTSPMKGPRSSMAKALALLLCSPQVPCSESSGFVKQHSKDSAPSMTTIRKSKP